MERWTRASSRQSVARHPGLLDELAPGTLERRLARGHAALRDLPGVLVERVAVLPDEEDPVLVVEDEDAGREVGEVDDAVDARLAVRPGDLVVPDRDPRVLVGDAAGVAGPRAAATGGVGRRCASSSIRGIVARGGRSRPVAGAGP